MGIEVGKVRKPSHYVNLFLFTCLRAKCYSCWEISESKQYIRVILHTLKSIVMEGYSKGILRRERVGFPFVVWCSIREYHCCLMVGWDACNVLH